MHIVILVRIILKHYWYQLSFQIWGALPTTIISVSLFIFPLVVDIFYWFDAECCFTPYKPSDNCYSFRYANALVLLIVNVILGVLTFSFIGVAVVCSRKRFTTLTPQTLRIERKLVVQTFISSYFLILLYITNFVSVFFENDLSAYSLTELLSAILFFLHHYPGMISLFVVSPIFRQRFARFYRIDKCCYFKRKR